MKKIWIVPVAFLLACGGNISEEQREKFKEGMEQQKIVRITEPDHECFSRKGPCRDELSRKEKIFAVTGGFD